MSIKWESRLDKAEKFFEDALTHGRKVYDRYEDNRDGSSSVKKVNFFYANVNTQKESLFNSLPKPDVTRIHKGSYDDDVARVAALIVSRALEYEVTTAVSFEEAVSCAVLDRLVPGVGQVWVRFGAPEETPGSEKIYIDTVYWEDFVYGPARTWTGVPWVGRILRLTKGEVIAQFGEEGLQKAESAKSSRNEESGVPEEIDSGKYEIYELWDKKTRKVSFICRGGEEPLKEIDDPYNLPGFFPCPRPLMANLVTKKFLPITDYHIAQDQYLQIDELYARTNLIIEAIKVAGVYDSSSPEIGRMLSGAENSLVPVDNWAMFAERGGSKGLIDWYPVEQVVTVLNHLQTQLEVCKNTLYEITGMSDIVRGASNQYETAKAQQIKAQFASVRLNGTQRELSKFVRDILRVVAGIVCNLYSDEKLAQVVGPLTPPDMAIAPQALEMLRGDFLSSFKIDIQADSLTQADWALEKEQRMAIVQTVGQMLQSTMQAVKEVPEMAVLSAQMIKFAVSGFKGSQEIEGWLDQQLDSMLKAQKQAEGQPKPPGPEELKAQADQQKMQMDMQIAQQKAQMEQQKAQMDAQVKQMEMANQQRMNEMEFAHQLRMNQLDLQMKQMDMIFKQRESQMKIEEKEEMSEGPESESESES